MANTVADQRRKNFYITENTVIDFYARKIGCTALAVYNVMERRCDGRSRQVKISNGYIAETLGISIRSVIRATDILAEYKLIHRESGKSSGENNRYILRNVNPPKASDSAPLFENEGVTKTTYPPHDDLENSNELAGNEAVTGGCDKNDIGGCDKNDIPGCDKNDIGGMSHLSQGCDKNDVAYKEDQDSFQDLRARTTAAPEQPPVVRVNLNCEVPPDDWNEKQCAIWFWEHIGQASDQGTRDLCADSLRLYARERGSKPNLVAVEVLARAKLAIDRGETINRFWFTDGAHKRDKGNGNGKRAAYVSAGQARTENNMAVLERSIRRELDREPEENRNQNGDHQDR